MLKMLGRYFYTLIASNVETLSLYIVYVLYMELTEIPYYSILFITFWVFFLSGSD